MNSRQLKKPVFGRWALDDVFVDNSLHFGWEGRILRLRFVGHTYICIYTYTQLYTYVQTRTDL